MACQLWIVRQVRGWYNWFLKPKKYYKWQLLPILLPGVWVWSQFGALSATARWFRGSLPTFRVRNTVALATGSREHRVSPPGLVRVFQLQRKSVFQWVPSAVQCVVSWNRMRNRDLLLPSDQACRPKANPPNCVLDNHSTSEHGPAAWLSTHYYKFGRSDKDVGNLCRLWRQNIRFTAMLAEGSVISLCATIIYYPADVILLRFNCRGSWNTNHQQQKTPLTLW